MQVTKRPLKLQPTWSDVNDKFHAIALLQPQAIADLQRYLIWPLLLIMLERVITFLFTLYGRNTRL